MICTIKIKPIKIHFSSKITNLKQISIFNIIKYVIVVLWKFSNRILMFTVIISQLVTIHRNHISISYDSL